MGKTTMVLPERIGSRLNTTYPIDCEWARPKKEVQIYFGMRVNSEVVELPERSIGRDLHRFHVVPSRREEIVSKLEVLLDQAVRKGNPGKGYAVRIRSNEPMQRARRNVAATAKPVDELAYASEYIDYQNIGITLHTIQPGTVLIHIVRNDPHIVFLPHGGGIVSRVKECRISIHRGTGKTLLEHKIPR